MTYVDPFLGAGGVWLCSLSAGLVPPVAWMGGKRRLALAILRILGVSPGSRPSALLGDASWWGWVWPVLLSSRGPEVCAWLRTWGEESPRELWFRLRSEGPAEDLAERAAGLLWLQARAASGVPVWWRDEATGPHLVQWASTKIDGAGQRQAHDPGARLRAGARGDRPATSYGAGQRTDRLLSFGGTGHLTSAGQKQLVSKANRTGGIVRTATVAKRIEAIRAAARGINTSFHHGDVADLTMEWAPRLSSRALVYLDPPYLGEQGKSRCPGYPAKCSREVVLAVADHWAKCGARVAVSESVDLSDDLGPGWSALRLRDGRKPEWLTTWGCDPVVGNGVEAAREGQTSPRRTHR